MGGSVGLYSFMVISKLGFISCLGEVLDLYGIVQPSSD